MNTRLYSILELNKDASEEEIKKAFKRLSMKWHPDKNPNNREEATKRFQEINSAHKILSDPDTRRTYDQFGEEGLKQGGNRPQGFNDIFSNLFGGAAGFNTQQGPQKCDPIVVPVELSLQNLYQGTKLDLKFQVQKPCAKCSGTGSNSGKESVCKACKGQKVVVQLRQMGPFTQQIVQDCYACNKTGREVPVDDVCTGCTGNGHVSVDKSMEFQIYPGMKWGMKIHLAQQGHEQRDRIPGDLILNLIPSQTSTFERKENDLTTTLTIDLMTALFCDEYTFKYLDGTYRKLQFVPPIHPGMVKKIRGLGMPLFHSEYLSQNKNMNDLTYTYGDLYISFNIKFPDLGRFSADDVNILREVLSKYTAPKQEPNSDTIVAVQCEDSVSLPKDKEHGNQESDTTEAQCTPQ